MTALRDYLDDYERRHPGFSERVRTNVEAFFDDEPERGELRPIPRGECQEAHRGPAGPNEDLGVCASCWGPSWSMRPEGESFGWHIADCSLPLRHEGYCMPGGNGHDVPDGWKFRG